MECGLAVITKDKDFVIKLGLEYNINVVIAPIRLDLHKLSDEFIALPLPLNKDKDVWHTMGRMLEGMKVVLFEGTGADDVEIPKEFEELVDYTMVPSYVNVKEYMDSLVKEGITDAKSRRM